MQRLINNDCFITDEQLIARWNNAVTRSTLLTWNSKGYGPCSTKLGRTLQYKLSDVIAWENFKRRKPE